MLAEILSVIMIRPEVCSLDGGWFITKLDNADQVFDASRAARIINHMYDIHPKAVAVLLRTLHGFVDSRDDRTIPTVIEETELLSPEVMTMLKQYPKVFISYAREDADVVEKLHSDLSRNGVLLWKDDHDLLPGEKWEQQIKRAISKSEFIIVCLSNASVTKRGYFQAEIRAALRKSQAYPMDDVCIIPVRVAPMNISDLPAEIAELQCVALDADWDKGITAILHSIKKYHRPQDNA